MIPFTLDRLRSVLIRLEDTIIFAAIERAQFAHNAPIYERGAMPFAELDQCFLRYLLREMERVHARVRRYTSPEEHAFTPLAELPAPILPPLQESNGGDGNRIHPNTVNWNQALYDAYVTKVVPAITADHHLELDDQHYGSSATRDVELLQALSKRIHYGKWIAEAKFLDPSLHDAYVALIHAKDRPGLMELLTDARVEERLLERVRHKTMTYAQDLSLDGHVPSAYKVPVEAVVEMYRNVIIPMTKEVEVDYLLQRLSGKEEIK